MKIRAIRVQFRLLPKNYHLLTPIITKQILFRHPLRLGRSSRAWHHLRQREPGAMRWAGMCLQRPPGRHPRKSRWRGRPRILSMSLSHIRCRWPGGRLFMDSLTGAGSDWGFLELAKSWRRPLFQAAPQPGRISSKNIIRIIERNTLTATSYECAPVLTAI